MDVITDPDVHGVVFMKPAQIGGSEIVLNTIGYYIDQDPSPLLVVHPTLDIAEWWSKRRLTPMLRDTPALRGKVSEIRAKRSDNTIKEKTFAGGSLTIAGANSPSGLASRPVRIVINDDTDRYPLSAGSEGSPIALSKKRSTTFWNRKHIQISSPAGADTSNIEPAYNMSDKRQYHVPCPKCKKYQVLIWQQVRWPKDDPAAANYVCPHCGRVIEDREKLDMLRRGKWVARKPANGVAGFHLNEIYSPWSTFGEMAINWINAQQLPETLQTFVNTAFAETWEIKGDTVAEEPLYNRREVYDEVPDGGLFLTAGVDVQDDRLEAEIVAWGEFEESWGIEYAVLWGDPRGQQVWEDLDGWLARKIMRETGHTMRVLACAIDSGFLADHVYQFSAPRWRRRVIAAKGYSTAGKPILSKPSRNNRWKARVFPLGTTTAKDVLYGRLSIKEPGPGYCHYPTRYDEEYFRQLTAEKAIKLWKSGRSTRTWVLKSRHRKNEALDVRLLALMARSMVKPNVARLRARYNQPPTAAEKIDVKRVEETAKPHDLVVEKQRPAKRKRARGYVWKGWK